MLRYFYLLLFLKLINCNIQIKCPDPIRSFGCKCYADFNYVSQKCPHGLNQLNCHLDNKNFTHLLSKLDSGCYSGLNFENVDQLPHNAFKKISLIPLARLYFKKVSQISSFSFENIDHSIQIIIDSDYFDGTQFESRCFSIIKNVSLIQLENFKLLELRGDFFQESLIDTIFINRSKYYGFDNLSIKTRTIVNNLVIKDSYTKGVLNDELLGHFYSLKTVSVINSGIEYVDDIFEKYAKLVKLDLGHNSIRTIDFNNKLLELNLFNNPVRNVNLVATGLKILNLKSTLVEKLSLFVPNLEHFSLAESKFITKFKNLNSLLDQIEDINVNKLKLIDVSHNEVYIDDELFAKEYLAKKNCLWNRLLNRTFVKINKNHKCDCSTIFLYKNLDLDLEEIRSVPTCYAKLLIESKVEQSQKECAFDEVYSNCSYLRVSTVMPLKTSDLELFVKKKIEWQFTIPITIGVFVGSLFILAIFALKAKKDFSKKFDKIYQNNEMNRPNVNQSEMQEIITISSRTISIRLNEKI